MEISYFSFAIPTLLMANIFLQKIIWFPNHVGIKRITPTQLVLQLQSHRVTPPILLLYCARETRRRATTPASLSPSKVSRATIARPIACRSPAFKPLENRRSRPADRPPQGKFFLALNPSSLVAPSPIFVFFFYMLSPILVFCFIFVRRK